MISKDTTRKIMALLVLILLAGLVVPPVSADYWENLTSINTTSWHDMTHNITLMRDVTIPANLNTAITASSSNITLTKSQILDATLVNTTMVLSATALNFTALSGNGTVIMNNGTAVPFYNLTASYTEIFGDTQSLNFTTAGAGTYLITANVRENTSVVAPQQLSVFTEYALCDGTGTAIVTDSERMGSRVQDTGNFSAVARSFSWIYTNSTGSTNVALCGKISAEVAGRYGIASDGDGRSVLNYIKLA